MFVTANRTVRAYTVLALAALAVAASAARADGQEPPDTAAARGWLSRAWEFFSIGPLVSIGSAAEERLRLEQLLGSATTDGFLLRAPSSLTPRPPHLLHLQLLLPERTALSNSAIPYSLNDGVLWAGRGTSMALRFGLRSRLGPLSLVLAPELVDVQNREFEILPWPLYLGRPGRDPFGSLWYSEGGDIDLPYRFGDEPLSELHPGQSSVALDVGPVRLGVATENQWWGPGIRNAIVLSNHAPGFPHAFLQTTRPLRTPIGSFEAKWLLGELRESEFYDTIPENDLRSLSGAILTYSPAFDPRITLGIARTVVSPADSAAEVRAHALRVFRSWDRRDSAAHVAWEPRTDQILALFGRWVLPDDGAEVYFEWARHELPVSLRDLLLAPHHTQGYTLGGQWARPAPIGVVRLQGELTQLEQSTTFKQRPFDPFYTGRAAPQGYTHRGQILGAAIGPGSSSQWLAVDLFGRLGSIGVFGGRIRWENDAFYASPSPNPERGHRSPHAHDVSVLGGLRAGLRLGPYELRGEYTHAKRYNYLFQNPDIFFGPGGAVDVTNRTVRLELTPARAPRLVRRGETP